MLRKPVLNLASLSFLILFIFPIQFSQAAAKPNVLLIMTDDQGWGDIQSHDNPLINTPQQDLLAKQGARFDRFYVSPVCAPTRAALMTGRYSLRTGVHGVTRGFENMRAEEVTIAEILKSAGYATGAFGKWHNGRHFPMHPNGQGFDEFFGFCGGHWNRYFDTNLEHNKIPVETKGYITDVLTDKAIEFIKQNQNQPFFCYVPYNAPHSPWIVPEKYWNKYANKGLDDKARCAYAMVESVDDNLGRLMQTLDELDLSKNTIVLFLTDNGPNSKRYNGDMRGQKGSIHEGGIRVPLFVRYPGKIKPGTVVKPIAAHIDILPTLRDFCGVSASPENRIDGKSLVPLLTGSPTEEWPKRMLFTDRLFRNSIPGKEIPVGSVRTERWRAAYERNHKWKLYDMLADPGQKKDVSKSHPKVIQKLKAAYTDWFKDVSQSGFEPIPIPVGHPQEKMTSLPANESFLKPEAGQGINYSGKGHNGYANSWLEDWTDSTASAVWHLDVVTPGTYSLTLKYTCSANDVGCEIQTEVANRKLTATITKAHDPPKIGNQDRIEQSPNYMSKKWGKINLGTAQLKKGRCDLRLTGLKKVGSKLIDVKGIELKRIN
ncbi:MAG: arylsulfatase [Planctomycetes bacterium]|nr:arylsulfatase [Planctomycetota bacterium]MCH9726417.1 arylsulfatase [Planctomycetota bacterium]MCH9778226.1 arylsulfatase [Planctomycetota bacterium]MCH9790376.1 arylsulfatase [Planctomycetota bacterium]MDF1745840.1 arylsulfatase [Gimesia sp.]